MKKWFPLILILVVFIECLSVAWVGFLLYRAKKSKKNVLGAVTVAPVRKEYLIASPSADLVHFYEPPANMQQQDEQSWLPYVAHYSINADTLNERYDYSVEKPSNVYRIVTLGDSFTFGHYVNTADNWAEKLEDMLNAQCLEGVTQKIEVINLGERGYDAQYIAHRFATRGKKYSPDLIIWLESGTGFDRLRELSEPLIQRYEQSLTPVQQEEAKEFGTYRYAWFLAQEQIHRQYSNAQIFEQIRSSWLDFFATRDSTQKVLIGTFSNTIPINRAKLKIITAGQPNTFLFFDIRDIHEHEGVLADGHPNVHGHSIIAADIKRYIAENKFLPCH